MKNELGRKLTSLTIMTVMLVGGVAIAMPGTMAPIEAQSEKLMYVSGESVEFGNTFGGGQIIEIIIADPARDETDETQSEPTVEVNGDTLRMAQGNDGYWYGYIADTTKVAAMDEAGSKGLVWNYGVAQTKGATINGGTVVECVGCSSSPQLTFDSDATVYIGATIIKGEPTLSDIYDGTANKSNKGQINATGINSKLGNDAWPFIQTFDFTEGDVEIVFEKPGADEVVLLDFDQPGDFASFNLDRYEGPAGAEVHIEIRDAALNIDPTEDDSWKFRTQTATAYGASYNASAKYYLNNVNSTWGFDDNGLLKITLNANSASTAAFANDATLDDTTADEYLVFTENCANCGTFSNTDDADDASIVVHSSALRGTTATVDYNDSAVSYVVKTYGGSIDMVESDAGDEWNSGEEIALILTDGDLNKNTASSEDQTINGSTTVPVITIGSPISMSLLTSSGGSAGDGNNMNGTMTLDTTSKIATWTINKTLQKFDRQTIASGTTAALVNALNSSTTNSGGSHPDATYASVGDIRVVSYDVSSWAKDDTCDIAGLNNTATKGAYIHSVSSDLLSDAQTSIMCEMNNHHASGEAFNMVIDWMAFGDADHDGIYRIEVEETDDNTGVFEGSIEYLMLNQLNYDDGVNMWGNGTFIGDSVDIIINADLTDESAPRVHYPDVDSDGVATPIADQVDAPTHSGTVDFDQDNYKVADTVTVTVDDQDLNTDSELIDVYIVKADDLVGDGDTFGTHILDVYFADKLFDDTCGATLGLTATGFQLTETDLASGVFTGTFQIPENYCGGAANAVSTSTTGEDMFVNYNDFRDAGGNEIEVGDAATVTANTGTVSLDRSVYPVPFTSAQYKQHDDVMISEGNITLTVTVADADYDLNPSGEDTIAAGVVTIFGYRGDKSATLESNFALTETAPSSGVFEYEFLLQTTDQINSIALKQGDVITASYVDPTDASGNSYTVTDSSTLDLRTGSLLSDKSVYVIGSDAIITLVEPDLNRDSGSIESYSLGLVEWDSDAGTVNLNDGSNGTFDPEPSAFRETGEDTGIFQVVIEIPSALGSTNLDRGEQIDLEYVDYGPAGEDNVADDTEDVELTIYTSNFGATIELDSKVYSWTERVFVTIVAPDHNTDSALVDEIGGDSTLTAQTRESKLTNYKLVENGPDTGIFIGEITLKGFTHDADGDGNDKTVTAPSATSAGPTDGELKASESDGVTVSFEYTEDSTVVSSSLIRWNIGEVSFNEDAYLSSGSAVVTIVDPDMNEGADNVDNFKVDVYSDSDSGGVELTVTETNEATGIFEGTVFFTTDDASSGHTLRVSEGDSITVDYADHTLPEPYSTSDDIDVSATAVIGTQTPPLERAPVANARVVDAFGNSLAEVSVDQQVQIEADLVNGQDGDQSFAYLVQVQDSDGVTVSLAWITGQLSAGQSFSPALSWIPDASGSYEATVFVWESVDNPTALSDTASVSITVV